VGLFSRWEFLLPELCVYAHKRDVVRVLCAALVRPARARLLSAAGELVLLLTDWQAFAQIDWAEGCKREPWAMAE
jgi:hypothetical protein